MEPVGASGGWPHFVMGAHVAVHSAVLVLGGFITLCFML